MRTVPCIAILAVASTLAFAVPAIAGDAARGGQLYSQQCQQCHAESVHSRVKRSARDFEGIREWVRHWVGVLKLDWAAEDVEDVTTYLNATYYRFAPPKVVT
jgi:mono/diheme cytochrome c family protein